MRRLGAMIEAELFSLSRRDITGRRKQPSLHLFNRLSNLIAGKVQRTSFSGGVAVGASAGDFGLASEGETVLINRRCQEYNIEHPLREAE